MHVKTDFDTDWNIQHNITLHDYMYNAKAQNSWYMKMYDIFFEDHIYIL